VNTKSIAPPGRAAPPTRGIDRQPESAAGGAGRPAVRCISSIDLRAGSQEAQIEHGDSIYRLRSTSQGKLILTK
jgi:hemin uptake protein HemP